MIWRVDRPRDARSGEAGFTLLELIVVIIILGLTLVLLIGRVNGPSTTLTLRAAANQLAAGMREARSKAIFTDRPVAIEIDVARHTWKAIDGTVTALPATAKISLTTLSGEMRSETTGGIRFEPDGSSSGGRVELADGNRRVDVGVDWLTGRISVGDAK